MSKVLRTTFLQDLLKSEDPMDRIQRSVDRYVNHDHSEEQSGRRDSASQGAQEKKIPIEEP